MAFYVRFMGSIYKLPYTRTEGVRVGVGATNFRLPPLGHFVMDFTKLLHFYQYSPHPPPSFDSPFEFLCTPLNPRVCIRRKYSLQKKGN